MSMTCGSLELEDLETEVEVPAGRIHDIEQQLDPSLLTPRRNSGGLHQNI